MKLRAALAAGFGVFMAGCASTTGSDMPGCLSEEKPTPELVACVDRELAPLRIERLRAYERAEEKYKDDSTMLLELEVRRKARDLVEHGLCAANAEIYALRNSAAGDSESTIKLEAARFFFRCQGQKLKQRIDELDGM